MPRSKPVSAQVRSLGRALRRLRKNAGLTLDEVAARVPMSKSYLSQFELGAKNPTITVLLGVLGAYGIELGDHLAGDQDELARAFQRMRALLGDDAILWAGSLDREELKASYDGARDAVDLLRLRRRRS